MKINIYFGVLNQKKKLFFLFVQNSKFRDEKSLAKAFYHSENESAFVAVYAGVLFLVPTPENSATRPMATRKNSSVSIDEENKNTSWHHL